MSVTTVSEDRATLKSRLRRAERMQRLRALGLVLPLFLFILVVFVTPIAILLTRAVDNPEIADNLPLTTTALKDWNGTDVPDEAVFAAFAEDLKAAQKSKATGLLGKRLNYELPGTRSKMLQAGRAAERMTEGPFKDAFLKLDPLWGKTETWNVIERASHRTTSFYLLKALDRQWSPTGSIEQVSPDQRLFVDVFVRTLGISVGVTLATLILGFPLAYILATLPPRHSNLLMILVLLPFWTSLLVRTTAWVVVLQTEGPVNDLLLWLGVTNEPLQLIFSRFGTIVAMTHIQLPFTLLPIYSVMKTISPNYVRAARSLGAGPFSAFWSIYFPQTMPGIAAGCLLTFILCLGYYITPALVGGPTDQMISYFVALYTNRELNWGQASALGAILLAATLVLYAVYNKLVGIDKMKLG
ncbi:ABC transporter permease [Dongia sp.]|uniref:ABC transporter permease n=1 Tax=Dongia sp. TaxID=1977262 RepID=UPI0035AF6D90